MTYRELARRAGYSASALSAAASGQALPTLDVVLAYVGACGADTRDWQHRWQHLSATRRVADQVARPGPGRMHAFAAAPGRDGGLEARRGPRVPYAMAPFATIPGRDADQEAPAGLGGAVTGARPVPPPVVAAESPAPPPVPAEPGKRRRLPVQRVHLGLAPIILATAAIVAYVILRAASPGTQLQTQPPFTGPVNAPSGSAFPPFRAQPTRAQPTATEPVTVPPGSAVQQPGPQPATGTQRPQAQVSQVRFDFEQPDQQWAVFWGHQVATAGITSNVAYRGTHSFMVTITGATASRGYSAIGVDHGLAGLAPGMQVTVHLWSSNPNSTAVRFFAMNSVSTVVWAPQSPGGVDIPLPAGSGWHAMTWTVPQVDQVHAIGIQIYSATNSPLFVALDDVSW